MNLFLSKADTLAQLKIKKATILPQICLNAWSWNTKRLKHQIQEKRWGSQLLIVRSSAYGEDTRSDSTAGKFTSIRSVRGFEALCHAIKKVTSSYAIPSLQDQVFIQPMLESVRMSGVIFSCDPSTGAPYRIINYDDVSGSSDLVTSGSTNDIKTCYVYRNHPGPFPNIIDMLEELESHFNSIPLDVEFAISQEGELFLLQVRPLPHKTSDLLPLEHKNLIENIESKVHLCNQPHPYLLGDKTILGIMPDWNPAEIIGTRPRPLALSLYKEMITDKIWAKRRHDYGYRDIQGAPLLFHLHGIPYIDVRASFNSLIPYSLDTNLAKKLMHYYLEKLEQQPHLHDKVEFDIVFSCYTFDLFDRLKPLKQQGFSDNELYKLEDALKFLTNRILDLEKGPFAEDLETINALEEKFTAIKTSSLDSASKIYWLLEDGKRLGTYPFVGIARGAFIGVQMLESLVHLGLLSAEEKSTFLSSLNTVCQKIKNAHFGLHPDTFLTQYGHLRQGTYDILSPRYDEAYHNYFLPHTATLTNTHTNLPNIEFSPKNESLIDKMLQEQGITGQTSKMLFKFIRLAIEAREHAKFLFTKNISEILKLIQQMGLSLDECSYLNIQDIKNLYTCCGDLKHLLIESASRGKRLHIYTKQILLPPLITCANDVWSFELKQALPNYITLKKAQGEVCFIPSKNKNFKGKILMLPSADPGYDWIFTHPIKGFITMYGGANSHMAIRSLEMGIPSVIGAGALLYEKWKKATILLIDCENKWVKIIQ